MKRLLCILLACLPQLLSAQINSSEVYYYKYVTTKGNGVYYEEMETPRLMDSEVYVILFAGKYMSYIACGSVDDFQKKMADGDNYWEDWVRTIYKKFCSRYNNPPTYNDFAMSQTNLPSAESLSLVATVRGQKFNSSLSDKEITTYTEGCAAAYTQGPSGLSMPKYWSGWSIKTLSFTFYNDLSKMWIWRTGNSNDMLVFERVSISDLKPNINDLKRKFSY